MIKSELNHILFLNAMPVQSCIESRTSEYQHHVKAEDQGHIFWRLPKSAGGGAMKPGPIVVRFNVKS